VLGATRYAAGHRWECVAGPPAWLTRTPDRRAVCRLLIHSPPVCASGCHAGCRSWSASFRPGRRPAAGRADPQRRGAGRLGEGRHRLVMDKDGKVEAWPADR